jgi:hypothetical protein
MLLCLDSTLVSGYLSNEVPGLVTGAVHLAGQSTPLRVELTGNFLRDIAGCRIEFQNPIPEVNPEHLKKLSDHQLGYVGQMTASYRVLRVPRSRRMAGPFMEPQGLKNLFFFEWYNKDRQRVLIQSWHYHLTVSVPRWQLSQVAERAQIRQNRARRKQFLLGDNTSPELGSGVDNSLINNREDVSVSPPTSPFLGLMEADPADPQTGLSESFGNSFALVNQVSEELSIELRRFEMLLSQPANMENKPAMLRLLTTAGDLAAHLAHVLRNFATLKSSQWQFLITDLEQSLPLFQAALNTCDNMVDSTPPGTDLRWIIAVQQSLLSISSNIEQLMRWLRNE